jgi:hypothetical protein
MTMPQAVISGDLIEIALELEQVAEVRQRQGTRDYDTPRIVVALFFKRSSWTEKRI